MFFRRIRQVEGQLGQFRLNMQAAYGGLKAIDYRLNSDCAKKSEVA